MQYLFEASSSGTTRPVARVRGRLPRAVLRGASLVVLGAAGSLIACDDEGAIAATPTLPSGEVGTPGVGGQPSQARTTHIVVAGVVRNQTGGILPGTTVRISTGTASATGSCDGMLPPVVATTDANGAYVWRVQSGPQNAVGCVVLEISPPQGSGMRGTTVRSPDVTFVSTDVTPPVSWRATALTP